VQATLSFGGRPFFCVLPWESIFAVTSSGTGEGQVWPEDLPTEAERGFSHEKHERARPQLAAVDDDEDEARPVQREAQPVQREAQPVQREAQPVQREAQPASREPPEGPKRAHLRLVR
jgi:hypothetical protein